MNHFKSAVLTATVLFLNTLYLRAQDYSHVYEVVKKYPSSVRTPEKLAFLINRDFNREEDKAVAAYIWIGSNIRYDVKEYQKIIKGKIKPKRFTARNKAELEKKYNKYNNDRVLIALRKKKGVCDHYSLIYKSVAIYAGLQVERVTGYSKNDYKDVGKMPRKSDHAWNKVKINNEWRYIDATWGAGYINTKTNKFVKQLNFYYCLTPEDKFSLNHIDDKLSRSEIAKQRTQFSKSPFYHGYYIGSNLELIAPATAKVSAKDKKIIEVKIRNFPQDKLLTYRFQTAKTNGFLKPISIEDSVATFELPCNFKLNDFAHLQIGSEPVATFRVSSK